MRNSGLKFPNVHVTVNLAPADIKKIGPAYDLPMALGLLMGSEQIPSDSLDDALVVGELALDGSVRHVRGILPMAAFARAKGFRRMFVPAEDAGEAALVRGIEVVAVPSLADVVMALTGASELAITQPAQTAGAAQLALPAGPALVDMQEIKGQEVARRALEVAAAGGHNVLMVGSPGAGKTLLARALPGILPALTVDESLDVTRLYSIADMLPPETPLIQQRPFRAPHHSISHAGMIGGGNFRAQAR